MDEWTVSFRLTVFSARVSMFIQSEQKDHPDPNFTKHEGTTHSSIQKKWFKGRCADSVRKRSGSKRQTTEAKGGENADRKQ